MKRTIFLFVIMVAATSSFAQKKAERFINLLSNDSVKYDIGKIGGTTLSKNSITLPTYQVEILSPVIDKTIIKNPSKQLIKKLVTFLGDPKKDWSANLLLYSLCKRDATPLIGVESRDEWLKNGKTSDSLYWNAKVR